MRDFPSCFSESGVQIADSSAPSSSNGRQIPQNLVTCVYQGKICGHSCSITVTWSKSLMGQGLSVSVADAKSQSVCKVDLKPWLFSKRKGSKSLDVMGGRTSVDVFWDLSSARFGSGPEPLDGYYLSLVVGCEMVLFLGDLQKEATRKTNASLPTLNPAFVAKREHIFGKRVFCANAQFCDNGTVHDLAIECETEGTIDPCLTIRIDKKMVMQVKRLAWKFRGNQTILVDGLPVEVYWDVYNWLFSQSLGSAVFMFQTTLSPEKLWSSQHFSDSSSKLPWAISRDNQTQHSGGLCNDRRLVDFRLTASPPSSCFQVSVCIAKFGCVAKQCFYDGGIMALECTYCCT